MLVEKLITFPCDRDFGEWKDKKEWNEFRCSTPWVDCCTFVYAITVAKLNEFVGSSSPWYIGFFLGGDSKEDALNSLQD